MFPLKRRRNWSTLLQAPASSVADHCVMLFAHSRSAGRYPGRKMTVLAVAVFAIGWPVGQLLSQSKEERVEQSGRSITSAPGGSDKSVSPADYFERGRFAESTQDYGEAARLYRRGAQRGHAPCQNNLGYMLLKGQGVPPDPKDAAAWFRDAARQSYPPAQNNLGVCYRDGLGVKQDEGIAAKWFLQAAEAGLAEAQNNLGIRFYRGRGMRQDTEEAMRWFTKAADQGLGNAWVNIGICYVEGNGAPKDLVKAFELFTRAAEKGDTDGLLSLGFAYMQGTKIPKDLVRAYICFNTAVSFGDNYASQARTKLRREMTDKQVSEAQRRSFETSTRDQAQRSNDSRSEP